MLKINDSSDKVSQIKNGKKKGRKSIIKIVTLTFTVVIVLYLLIAIVLGMYSNLSTTVALKGSVREEVRTYGYVLREQTVIDAPWSGCFESLVSEGERVREGQVIGYIYQEQPTPEVVEELKKLHKILLLKGTEEDDILSVSGTGATEKKISEYTRDLSDIRQNCDLSEALEKKEEINVLIERKNSVADTAQEVEVSELEQIKGRLSSLEAQAGASVKIIASVGGVFSSGIDGLEDKLSYDVADEFTPSYIEELDKTEVLSVNNVEAGQPLCKIINNYMWKYATVLSEKEAEEISIGQGVQMRFYDLASGLINGTVSRISEVENGKRAIVISTNKHIDGIYSTSRINADIVTVNSGGIKLPSECLRVKDGVTGVYVIRLDVAKFVPVNLIYRNEDWAIVSAAEAELGGTKLKIYDEVIVKCRNLEDGKVVR